MSDAENDAPNANGKRTSALQLGPRKKMYVFFIFLEILLWQAVISSTTDPLVHHGRHFCRTVHAMCNLQALLTNGVLLEVKQAETSEEDFTSEYITQWLCLFLPMLILIPLKWTSWVCNIQGVDEDCAQTGGAYYEWIWRWDEYCCWTCEYCPLPWPGTWIYFFV